MNSPAILCHSLPGTWFSDGPERAVGFQRLGVLLLSQFNCWVKCNKREKRSNEVFFKIFESYTLFISNTACASFVYLDLREQKWTKNKWENTLAKEPHSSPWTQKAGQKVRCQTGNTDKVEGVTSLVLRGTDTCPWTDLCGILHLLNEADAGHTTRSSLIHLMWKQSDCRVEWVSETLKSTKWVPLGEKSNEFIFYFFISLP